MNKFLLFIFLIFPFFSKATEEHRKALIKNVNIAVSDQERINAKIELTEFYESYDFRKWQNGVEELKENYRTLKNRKLKNRIAISLAKSAYNAGNQDEFYSYFKAIDIKNQSFDRISQTEYNFLKIKSYLIETNYQAAKKRRF